MKTVNKFRVVLTISAATSVLTGCQTYQSQNQAAVHYRNGNLAQAEAEAAKKAASNQDTKDALIWKLEEGTILRAAQKFQESNKAFQVAQQRVEDNEASARVSVSRETFALLSNLANLPYSGRGYDKIMMATYTALNFMQLGDLEKALVALNAAEKYQGDAVEANKKRIAEMQDALEKHAEREKIKQAQEDAAMKSKLAEAYGNLDQLEAYADYVNPFTIYLHGIFRVAIGDYERGRQLLKTALASAQNNRFIAEDLDVAESAAGGKVPDPVTYVIFETGSAPEREQFRIDIPIVVAEPTYVGAAFPRLKMNDSYVHHLEVVTGGSNVVSTELVASIDSVVGQDFKNELPTIITKTIASTLIKAAANYGINKGAERGGIYGKLLAKAGAIVLQSAMNIADTRTWTSLPKQIQVARIPTPPNRRLQLRAASGGPSTAVTLNEGTVNVIYVKCVSEPNSMTVTQTKLL